MTKLFQFLILPATFAVFYFVAACNRPVHATVSRDCQVSVFPILIRKGTQCRRGELMNGFDLDAGEVACGTVNVICY